MIVIYKYLHFAEEITPHLSSIEVVACKQIFKEYIKQRTVPTLGDVVSLSSDSQILALKPADEIRKHLEKVIKKKIKKGKKGKKRKKDKTEEREEKSFPPPKRGRMYKPEEGTFILFCQNLCAKVKHFVELVWGSGKSSE